MLRAPWPVFETSLVLCSLRCLPPPTEILHYNFSELVKLLVWVLWDFTHIYIYVSLSDTVLFRPLYE